MHLSSPRPLRATPFAAVAAVRALAGACLAVTLAACSADTPSPSTTPAGTPAAGTPSAGSPSATPAPAAAVDYRAVPARHWQVKPDQVLSGSEFSSPGTDSLSTVPEIVGDVVVVRAVTPRGERSVLAGIDASSGKIRWRHASADQVFCLAVSIDRLACVRTAPRTSRGPQQGARLDLLDARTGIVAVAGPRVPGILLAYDGTSLYVGGARGDRARIEKLAIADLSRRWIRTYRPQVDPGGDAFSLSVSGGIASLSLGSVSWSADANDGTEIRLPVGAEQPMPYQNLIVAVTGGDSPRTVVADPAGTPLLEATGRPWTYSYQGDRGDVGARIGIGSTLYDVASGQPVWKRSDLGGEFAEWTWTPDRRQVIVTDGDNGMQVLDAADGTDQWHGRSGIQTWSTTAYLSSDGTSVTARDRATGTPAWTRPLRTEREYVDFVGVSEGSVLVGDRESLEGLSGFASE